MNPKQHICIFVLFVLVAGLLSGCQDAANIAVSESAGFLSLFVNPDRSANLYGYSGVFFIVFWLAFFMNESDSGIGGPIFVATFASGMIYLMIANTFGSSLDSSAPKASKTKDLNLTKYEQRFKERFGDLDDYDAYGWKFDYLDKHKEIDFMLANQKYMFFFFGDKDITQKCPSSLCQSDECLSLDGKEPIVMYQGKWYIDKRIKLFVSKEKTMDYIRECLSIATKTLEEKTVTKERMKENIDSWRKQHER